jgi:hypothetical protein
LIVWRNRLDWRRLAGYYKGNGHYKKVNSRPLFFHLWEVSIMYKKDLGKLPWDKSNAKKQSSVSNTVIEIAEFNPLTDFKGNVNYIAHS